MTLLRKTFLFAPALFLAALLVCGCRSGRAPRTLVLHYNATRPGLIRESGRTDLPREVRDRRIDSVAASGGMALFGVRDTGVSLYDIRRDTWLSIPFDPHPLNDELIITSLTFLDGKIFAAASGIGLLRCDPGTRSCQPVTASRDARLKTVYEIMAAGGQIWIAAAHGLFAFDPGTERVSLVVNKPSLALARDKGRIWALIADTSDGMQILGLQADTMKISKRKNLPQGMQGGHALLVRDGHVLLATIGGRLVDFDPGTGKILSTPFPDNLAGILPEQMCILGEDLAIASEAGLLLYGAGSGFRLLQQEHGLPSARVTGVAVAGDVLFLGLSSGAFVVTAERLTDMEHIAKAGGAAAETVREDASGVSDWHHLTITDGLLNNTVQSLLPLSGEAWVGANIMGLTRIDLAADPPKATAFIPEGKGRAKSDRTMLAVMELAADGDNIWHGGYGYYGRFSRSRGRWAAPATRLNQPYEYDVEALWVGPGQVWMGVRKEGLRVLDRKTGEWKRIEPDYLNLSPMVTDILHAAGALWLSSDVGLRRYNEKKDSFVYVDIEGVHDIESMAADGDTLWMGTRERSTPGGPLNTGLFRYNMRTRHLTPLNAGDGARLKHVNKVFLDGPDVWVAARQGLGRFDRLTGEWTLYAADKDLDAGDILSVAVAADWLLAGTDNGLFLKRIRTFDNPDDLAAFRRAWNAERSGRDIEAAQAFEHLALRVPRAAGDRLLYRAARCLERAGRTADALRIQRSLLPQYPMLALDMEGAITAEQGFDAWLAAVDNLARTAKTKINASPHKAALVRAHLQFLEQPLAHQNRERTGTNRAANTRR